jgi:hypothetical protein
LKIFQFQGDFTEYYLLKSYHEEQNVVQQKGIFKTIGDLRKINECFLLVVEANRTSIIQCRTLCLTRPFRAGIRRGDKATCRHPPSFLLSHLLSSATCTGLEIDELEKFEHHQELQNAVAAAMMERVQKFLDRESLRT